MVPVWFWDMLTTGLGRPPELFASTTVTFVVRIICCAVTSWFVRLRAGFVQTMARMLLRRPLQMKTWIM